MYGLCSYIFTTTEIQNSPLVSIVAIVGTLILLLVVILVIVIVVVAVCTIKKKSLTNSVDRYLYDDVVHCSVHVNPSVHNTTTIVYDDVHTTPSCTDNPAYGIQ